MRPTSVTFISWLLIIGGVVGVLAVDYARQNGHVTPFPARGALSPFIQIAAAYGVIAVQVLFGILLLNGVNWGRILFVLSGIAQYVYLFAIAPAFHWPHLIGPLIFALMALALFRPHANAYFRRRPYPEDIRGMYWHGGH